MEIADITFFGFEISKEVVLLALIPVVCAVLVLVAGVVQYILTDVLPDPRVKKLLRSIFVRSS